MAMRLLLINYEYPPVGAGAATATAEIARSAARKGYEVTVLTSAYGGNAGWSRDGTPEGNAHAQADAWPKTIAFLKRTLGVKD